MTIIMIAKSLSCYSFAAGTPLFEIPLTGNEIWEYKLGPTERVDGKPLLKLQGYLKLLRSADKYEMVLNQPLDIESIYDSFVRQHA